MTTRVSASAPLTTMTELALGFDKPAKLADVAVKAGDPVQPGQILARQDPSTFNNTLNRERAALAVLQRRLTQAPNDVPPSPRPGNDPSLPAKPWTIERYPTPHRPGENLDEQRAVADQVAAVARAQHDVDNTVLYAPTGGTVSRITATPCQAVPGADTVMTLDNIDSYRLTVPFEPSDGAKVEPNQDVELTFDGLPGLRLPGKVQSVAPPVPTSAQPDTYHADIVLTKTDPRLRAGRGATARVITNRLDNTLVVPNSAVLKDGGSSYVNLVGPDGPPVRHPFIPGAVGDDNTQVLGGLTDGQEVVVG